MGGADGAARREAQSARDRGAAGAGAEHAQSGTGAHVGTGERYDASVGGARAARLQHQPRRLPTLGLGSVLLTPVADALRCVQHILLSAHSRYADAARLCRPMQGKRIFSACKKSSGSVSVWHPQAPNHISQARRGGWPVFT